MAGFDVLIRGGTVLDGTGAEGFPADVGISGGKIAAVGRLDAPAGQVIDAAGMVVTPGFLDIHRHADLAALRGAGCWGAVIGKAYYTGAIDLSAAVRENA